MAEIFPVHAWAHVLGNKRPARYAILLVLDRRPVPTAPGEAADVRVYGAVDVHWQVDHVSSGVEVLLGHDPDELVGVLLSRLIHPDDFPQLFAGLAATTASRLGALGTGAVLVRGRALANMPHAVRAARQAARIRFHHSLDGVRRIPLKWRPRTPMTSCNA